jgi:hypothetical protein
MERPSEREEHSDDEVEGKGSCMSRYLSVWFLLTMHFTQLGQRGLGLLS